MSALYLGAAVAFLLTIVLGLGHVFRQPGRAESLLAALRTIWRDYCRTPLGAAKE